MPKPANVERFTREWVQQEGLGDLVAYTRCITTTVSLLMAGTGQNISASPTDPASVAVLLGRELSDSRLPVGSTRALVLTSTRFLVLQLSGWKERVKQTELDVDAAGVVVHHLDALQSHGHTARYFFVDLPDGTWMYDSMIVTMKNGKRGPFADTADHFLAALGPRARLIQTA